MDASYELPIPLGDESATSEALERAFGACLQRLEVAMEQGIEHGRTYAPDLLDALLSDLRALAAEPRAPTTAAHTPAAPSPVPAPAPADAAPAADVPPVVHYGVICDGCGQARVCSWPFRPNN